MRTRIPSFCLPYVQISAENLEAGADHTLEMNIKLEERL